MTTTRSLRVLMYHRIAQPESSAHNPSTISATPDGFDRQMRILAERYHVVSSGDVLDAIEGRGALPADAVLITFDDGCRDFAAQAWPILKRYRLPVTLFVPTAFPDDPYRVFWWDRLYRAFTFTEQSSIESPRGPLPLHSAAARSSSLRQMQQYLKTIPHTEAMRLADRLCTALGYRGPSRSDVLTWTELGQLAAEGVEFGAHTHTHPALTRLPREDARDEIRRSRDELHHRMGAAPRVFAYPFGDFDDGVVNIVREEGFALAVTCRDGHNVIPGAHPLRLCRTNVTTRTTPLVFRIRLTPTGASLDRWRHRHHGRASSTDDLPAAAVRSQDRGAPRVAYIMSRFPKLSETFVLNEIRTIASLGMPIEIYPLRRGRQSVRHPEAAEWTRRAHFHSLLSFATLRAQAQFFLQYPSTYVGLYAKVLRETFGGRPKAFVGAAVAFPRAVWFAADMQRRGVTHVHAHFANHPTVAAYVVHCLTGIPFSFTAHGSDLHVDRHMLDTKVAAASFAVTVSKFNKQVIVESCGAHTADKVHVIHCGVDPDVFAPAPAGEKCRTPFRIVCVASFEEVKGHQYLVEACSILRDRGVDFRCDLVGEGPLVRAIRGQIARCGLTDRVRILGGQPRPEVARLLARAGAAVLASHPTPQGKREGVPVALMEAMACGTPVVASAISGIPELVESGRTGLLVPSGNALLLAYALELLIGEPELCDRLGRAGREKVLQEFRLDTNARHLAALFTVGPPRTGQPELTDRLPVSSGGNAARSGSVQVPPEETCVRH